ncbi:MAG: hypothetical protein ACRDCY_00790 [Aeromonas veronii]
MLADLEQEMKRLRLIENGLLNYSGGVFELISICNKIIEEIAQDNIEDVEQQLFVIIRFFDAIIKVGELKDMRRLKSYPRVSTLGYLERS